MLGARAILLVLPDCGAMIRPWRLTSMRLRRCCVNLTAEAALLEVPAHMG